MTNTPASGAWVGAYSAALLRPLAETEICFRAVINRNGVQPPMWQSLYAQPPFTCVYTPCEGMQETHPAMFVWSNLYPAIYQAKMHTYGCEDVVEVWQVEAFRPELVPHDSVLRAVVMRYKLEMTPADREVLGPKGLGIWKRWRTDTMPPDEYHRVPRSMAGSIYTLITDALTWTRRLAVFKDGQVDPSGPQNWRDYLTMEEQ